MLTSSVLWRYRVDDLPDVRLVLVQTVTTSRSAHRLVAAGIAPIIVGLGALVASAWASPPSLAVFLIAGVVIGVSPVSRLREICINIRQSADAECIAFHRGRRGVRFGARSSSASAGVGDDSIERCFENVLSRGRIARRPQPTPRAELDATLVRQTRGWARRETGPAKSAARPNLGKRASSSPWTRPCPATGQSGGRKASSSVAATSSRAQPTEVIN